MKLNIFNITEFVQQNLNFFTMFNRSSLKIYKLEIIDYYQNNSLCSHSVKTLLR